MWTQISLVKEITSGGFLVLSGPRTHFPLVWVSKRQTSVSRSTTEAEIVSLAYQEALPALSRWELISDRPFHLKIHEDNKATILVAKRGFSSKLRCVQRTHKVNLACVAEQLESDRISIEYVKTDMQSADIFTKALPPNKRDRAIRLLGIRVDLPEKLEPDLAHPHLTLGASHRTKRQHRLRPRSWQQLQLARGGLTTLPTWALPPHHAEEHTPLP